MRVAPDLQRALVHVRAVSGLLYFASHPDDKLVKKATRGLCPCLQEHLLGVEFWPGAVADYLRALSDALRSPRLMADNNLGSFAYSLFNPVELYWGYGAAERKDDIGIVGRPAEHFSSLHKILLKTTTQERTFERRYQLFSGMQIHAVYFVPLYIGAGQQAYGLEQYAIRVCPTRPNARARRPNAEEKRRVARLEHLWEQPKVKAERACLLNFRKRISSAGSSPLMGVEDQAGWAHLSFDALYRFAQGAVFDLVGAAGPLNIYDPDSSTLLLSWMLANPGLRSDDVFRPTTSKHVWLGAANLCEQIPPGSQRRSVSSKLRIILRKFGFVWGKVKCPVEAHPAFKASTFRRRVFGCLAKHEHPSTVRYLSKRLLIITKKGPTYHTRGRKHRSFAKGFELEHLTKIPPQRQAEYLKGKSICFVAQSCDVPFAQANRAERTRSTLKEGLVRAANAIRVQHLIPELCRCVLGPVGRECSKYDVSHPDPPHLVAHQERIAPGVDENGEPRLLATEDKDTRMSVCVAQDFLTVWIHHMYFHDDDHLEFVAWSPDELISYMYFMHLALLPERFHTRDRQKWLVEQVYEYITFKRKCFLEDHKHTCEKPNHVCCRRIGANMTPIQEAESLAGRAIDMMARSEACGPLAPAASVRHFQTWTCEEFTDALHTSFRRLVFVRAFLTSCIECGEQKDLMSVAHGDSSAMYDEVLEDSAQEGYDELNERATACRKPEHITVRKGLKGKARWGAKKCKTGREVVFSRNELRRVLVFSHRIAYNRIGKHVFRRKKGVPMGGGASGIKAGLVYRRHERRFLRRPRVAWRKWGLARLARFPPAALTQLVAPIRIADDDFTISTVHCPVCTSRLLSRVYPPPLLHGAEEWGTRARVIDTGVEVRGAQYSVVRLNRNMDYICGGVPDQLRTRYLPPLPPPILTRKLMSSWIAGSMALDRARNTHPAHMCAQGLTLCGELLRLSHSPRTVSRALRAVRHPHLRQVAHFTARILSVFERVSATRPIGPSELVSLFLPTWTRLLGTSLLIPGIFPR